MNEELALSLIAWRGAWQVWCNQNRQTRRGFEDLRQCYDLAEAIDKHLPNEPSEGYSPPKIASKAKQAEG